MIDFWHTYLRMNPQYRMGWLLDVVGFVFAKILLRKSLSPDLQAVSFPTAGDANDALQTLCVHL